jgi:hypothetical protein
MCIREGEREQRERKEEGKREGVTLCTSCSGGDSGGGVVELVVIVVVVWWRWFASNNNNSSVTMILFNGVRPKLVDNASRLR